MMIKIMEVGGAGDFQFSHGTYIDKMVLKSVGKELMFDGKFLTIFKRQPDGSLKIYRDAYNSNIPPN